ncbi:hypothetical protein JTB14_034864 [Gonioctena quinquepunctata]|nr:hypothetical protein JTB14_034864 [Gonioctena quinquepunctata]
MMVDIKLMDYNDEVPVFNQSDYDVTIEETADKDEFIIQVLATDRDAEDEILRHSLIGSTYTQRVLRIDSNTGKIYVNAKNAFDYDTVNPVFVQVRATDKVEHIATVPLTINLRDVNNKAPTVDAGKLISVEENQLEGTVLNATITASDIDTTGNLTVEINWSESYAMKNSRRVDTTNETIRQQMEFLDVSQTGTGREIQMILTVNSATTKIAAPDFELFDSLFLSLIVTDLNTDPKFLDKKNTTALILISIIDINDNTPYFPNNSNTENRTVEENADIGTSVGSIVAVDLDVTNTVTYNCTADDTKFDWIEVDKKYGTFSVKEGAVINADLPPTFYFNYSCTASDDDMTHTSDVLPVGFYILDRNNRVPVIDIKENVHIDEKPADKTKVVEIGVNDDDRDIPFHTARCGFPDQTTICAKKFYIENNAVFVNIGNDLNRDEYETNFTCYIKCEDNQERWRAEGTLSANATFTIILDDINDHTPALDIGDIMVYENVNKNDTISLIIGKDIDEGPNAEIDFVHLVAEEDLKGYYGTYIITINLSDRGSPPLTVNETRTLTVGKFNFYQPRIISPKNGSSYTLFSDQQKNSSLAIFRSTEFLEDFVAYDNPDENVCQKWDINFDVNQLSPAPDDTIFKIAKQSNCTSQLQINDKYNSDYVIDKKVFELQIIARINNENDEPLPGEALYYASSNISITFVDNALQPYFEKTTLSLKFREANASQVSELENKATYGIKNTEDLNIFYFLITDNKTIESIFEVSKTTGAVSVVNKFYYDYDEEFKFQIKVSNDTNPATNTRTNSSLDVTVEVIPINRRAPEFRFDTYFGAILPGFVLGTPIITVEATDPDIVDQDDLEFSIEGEIKATGSGLNNIPKPAFEMDSKTGRISLEFGVENTMTGYFTFEICVKDKVDAFGNGPFKTCTTATIFIITDDKTVDFRFYNNITMVQEHEKEMLVIMSNVLDLQAYRQSITNQTYDGDIYTRARLYFFNNTNSFYADGRYQDGSSVTAVDSTVVMRLVSNYETFTKLQLELRNELQLYLVPFPATDTASSSQLQAWLVGVSAVLAAVCLFLLIIFIFKIRQLNKRISNLTSKRFGSQDSGLNRLGISAPTTNKHAIEGSNPIFNVEDAKKSKGDFDTHSIRSGDSDLIGVEDSPEFDYNFNQRDDKTTYL